MRLTSAELEDQLRKVRDLESRLTFQLAVLSRALDHQGAEMLRDQSINLTAYRILNIVDTWGAISISDLSRTCGIDRGQISRTAEALAKQELVRFEGDSDNKRKKLVALTKEGRAKLDEVRPRFVARNHRLEEALGPEALDGLRKGLQRLSEVMDE
ncbi:MarR family transcriptional regulator [Mameliella alba]|nr:MarR family transcriptional regulator [Antarctobacter heliothermus]MBY6143172.1 MarR family transcriptional regulator [Mameliella alba]MCA0953104.1 MarR family transcriptional regulator [Mameliella alba]